LEPSAKWLQVSKLIKQRHMLLVSSTYKLTWEEPTLDQPARNTPARYKVAELN
jgi:hypothetical protein